MNSKGHMQGVRWLITGLLLLGILALMLRAPKGARQVLDQLRADGYPVTSEELNAFYPEVPFEENAAIPLAEALSLYRQPKANVPFMGFNRPTLKRGEAWSDTSKLAAREFLDENAEVRSLLTVATQKSGCRFPLDFTKGPALIPQHLTQINVLGLLLVIEAELAMEEGRPADAARALLDGLILSDCLKKEPVLVSQLVRISSITLQANSLERVLNRGSFNETDLARLQEGFVTFQDSSFFLYTMLGAFSEGLSVFRGNTDNMSGMVGAFQVVPTLAQKPTLWAYDAFGFRAADEAFYVRAMGKILRTSKQEGLKRLEVMNDIKSEMAIGEHSFFRFDRMASDLLLPFLFKYSEVEFGLQSRVRLAELACALERYRAHHDNALPSSLDVLVPEYISVIPEDPWDEKPLRYRPLADGPGYMLYSVGSSQTDDGGLVRLQGSKIDNNLIEMTWVVTR
jgi:hypothetical protein